MENLKITFSRFLLADNNSKKIKVKNRFKSFLKLHRKIYWILWKKIGKESIKSRKYEEFIIPLSDQSLGKHLFIDGQFDFDKLIKVNNLINLNERILIDVGANIGPICIPALKRSIVTKSIAIEPDKYSFEFLRKNVLLNNLTEIQVINAVVGAENGMELFGSKKKNLGDSKVINEKNEKEFSEIYTVNKITLNSLVNEVRSCDYLIWMDVQGFEPFVIEGASKFTDVRTPIVVEIFPLAINEYSNFDKIQKLLKNYLQFANLKFDIDFPVFESMDNFKSEYMKLEKSNSYSDYLFI